MKPVIIFLAFAFFFSLPQKGTSQVYQTDEHMSQGTNPALIIEIEVDNTKLVENVWKDFMKEYGGKTKKSKGGEWMTTGADIVGVNGVQPMDVYSKTSSSSNGVVQHAVWFKLGENWLESYMKDEFDEAGKMLEKFALECKVENTNLEIKDAEKKLRSLENDLDRLKRQNDGYHIDIEQAEKRIEQAKENISKNEDQQVEAAEKIELQKELLEEIMQRLKDLKNI